MPIIAKNISDNQKNMGFRGFYASEAALLVSHGRFVWCKIYSYVNAVLCRWNGKCQCTRFAENHFWMTFGILSHQYMVCRESGTICFAIERHDHSSTTTDTHDTFLFFKSDMRYGVQVSAPCTHKTLLVRCFCGSVGATLLIMQLLKIVFAVQTAHNVCL